MGVIRPRTFGGYSGDLYADNIYDARGNIVASTVFCKKAKGDDIQYNALV